MHQGLSELLRGEYRGVLQSAEKTPQLDVMLGLFMTPKTRALV